MCRLRLKLHARTLLYIAGTMARFGFKLPHPLVNSVVRRSWEMRTADGWQAIRLDQNNRII